MIGKQAKIFITTFIISIFIISLFPVNSNAVDISTLDLIDPGDTVVITDGNYWEKTFTAPCSVDMATLSVIGRLVLGNENGAQWSMKVYVNGNEIVADDVLVDPQTHYCPNHPSFESFWENSYYGNRNTGVMAWDLAYDNDFDADATSGIYYRPRTDIYEYVWAINSYINPGATNTLRIENVNSYGYSIELSKATVDIYSNDVSEVKWKTKTFDPVPLYCEDFNDGTADDWSTGSGSWAVENYEYSGSSSSEFWNFYGSEFSKDIAIEFKINFQTTPGGGVGKHGGVMLFASSKTTGRWSNTGYTIDYIDRDSDQGYRFYKWSGGYTYLNRVYADEINANQWYTWTVTVVGDVISLYVDGVFIGSVTDNSYRTGYFGLWGYNDNHIHFDDIKITGKVDVYFTSSFKINDVTSGTEYGMTMKIQNLVTSNTPITVTGVSLRPHEVTPKSNSVSNLRITGIPSSGIELDDDGSMASFCVFMTPTLSGKHATVHLWIEFKTVCGDEYKVGVNVMFRK
jgi:hypothetical protein